jgi:hypothetical protein
MKVLILLIFSFLVSCSSLTKVTNETLGNEEKGDNNLFFFHIEGTSNTGAYKLINLNYGALSNNSYPFSSIVDFYSKPTIRITNENIDTPNNINQCVLVNTDNKFYSLMTIDILTENKNYKIKESSLKPNFLGKEGNNLIPKFEGKIILIDGSFKFEKENVQSKNHCLKELKKSLPQIKFD